MENMKVIKFPWKDFDGSKTEAIELNVDRQYTISDLIQLLEEAKKLWGDKEILIHESNLDIIGGFGKLYLRHGFDHREEYGEDNYTDGTNCWLCYEGKFTELIDYLDSVVESNAWLREDDTWHEQSAFARKCMELMLALPEVPEVLWKDKSRYVLKPETYPALNKLNKCFNALQLPYTLRSEQRRYDKKKERAAGNWIKGNKELVGCVRIKGFEASQSQYQDISKHWNKILIVTVFPTYYSRGSSSK